jgi:hypothetical protein
MVAPIFYSARVRRLSVLGLTLGIVFASLSTASAFSATSRQLYHSAQSSFFRNRHSQRLCATRKPTLRRSIRSPMQRSSLRRTVVQLPMMTINSFSEPDQALAFWIIAFASSHIGMSATRNRLIILAGEFADRFRLVGTAGWKLPSFWPGDKVAGQQIWPDTETTGRQIYRIGYTSLSFITLGNALAFYLQSSSATTESLGPSLWFAVAVAANTASLSSLANASPLGLMPGFQASSTVSSVSELRLERNDTLKFKVQGLTRITRHPLILPVVPWGVANAFLLGGRPCDWLLFGGLSLYAVAGCTAQDLRISRQEGSVGTVFQANTVDQEPLQSFFEATSFVPFLAIFDGRQNLADTVRETPWLAVAISSVLGFVIEENMVAFLQSYSY